jgi:hypothetical protein
MKKQTKKQAAESAAYRARHDEIGKILDNRGIRAALAEVSKGLERMTLRREIVKFLDKQLTKCVNLQWTTHRARFKALSAVRRRRDAELDETAMELATRSDRSTSKPDISGRFRSSRMMS